MTPIQLWLPTFFGGIARPELRRDMQRMFRKRRREQVMWSVPGWAGPPHWKQDGIGVSCVNGESLECARILHVGANGAIVGPAAAAFPNMTVAGLLDAWLNEEFVTASPARPGEKVRIRIPHPVNGGVALVDAELTLPGAQYLPITHLGDGQVAYAQWPPRADMPSTVSPELESLRSASDIPKSALSLRFAWSAPFEQLQPLVISLDDIMARDRMRLIAEDSRKDPAKAVAQAQTEARGWVSEGQATVNEAWLQPIIAEEGEEGALFAIAARFGIEVGSLTDACQSRELREHLNASMQVVRAWGAPGLMWALLVDSLSNARPFRVCERCGRAISGRGHKRFCSASDDPACYQARKAADKRRSRAQRPRGHRP